MILTAKIVILLTCAALTAAYGLNRSVRLYPVGLEVIFKLRGNCAAVCVELTLFNVFKPFALKRFIAYDGLNGLILCGGDINTFGDPVIAGSRRKKKRKASFSQIRELAGAVKVRSIEAYGSIGGEGRADKAALAFGALQTLFAQLKAALPETEVGFEATAELYDKKVCLDIKCIASLSLGKFIIKAITLRLLKGGNKQ